MSLGTGRKRSTQPLSSEVQWLLAQAARVTHTQTFFLQHLRLKPPLHMACFTPTDAGGGNLVGDQLVALISI
eukprot:12889406-Prorocentrum_lima.AAC.1